MTEGASAGMSLRDYFAAAAVQGMASREASAIYSAWELAGWAYEIADAMLKKRDEP